MTNAIREYHGGRHTPAYKTWCSMKERCTNPRSKAYEAYGARGIAVCERWRHSFVNFLSDMGPRPPGASIDRIDPARGYEPGNCRWANRSDQAANQQRYAEQRANGRRGIYFHKRAGKWLAQIKANGVHHYLGLFLTPEDACAAYRVKYEELFGAWKK